MEHETGNRVIFFVLLFWTALIFAIFAIFVWVAPAAAHSWYDPACCNDNDCAPNDDVEEVKGGFRVPSGEVVPYGDKRIRQSLDKRFHWCHVNAYTYCVYIPGGAT